MDKTVLKKHQPILILSGSSGRVFVNGEDKSADGSPPAKLHPMTPDHFIKAVYVLDGKDNVVYYEELPLEGGQGEAKSKTFNAPPGATLTPYQFCNKHGLWEGKAVKSESGGGEL